MCLSLSRRGKRLTHSRHSGGEKTERQEKGLTWSKFTTRDLFFSLSVSLYLFLFIPSSLPPVSRLSSSFFFPHETEGRKKIPSFCCLPLFARRKVVKTSVCKSWVTCMHHQELYCRRGTGCGRGPHTYADPAALKKPVVRGEQMQSCLPFIFAGLRFHAGLVFLLNPSVILHDGCCMLFRHYVCIQSA